MLRRLALLAQKVLHSVQTDGVAGTIRKIRASSSDAPQPVRDFDAARGVDTDGNIPLWKLKVDSANAADGVRYQPMQQDWLEESVRTLGLDVSRFDFVDLGCGKGRAVIIAAEMGFASSTGVEFAQELAETAQTNLDILKLKNSRIVHGDAAAYDFPTGDLMVYMNNPFGESVMRPVIAKLAQAIAARPDRTVTVVYHHAYCPAPIDEVAALRRAGESKTSDLAPIILWTNK